MSRWGLRTRRECVTQIFPLIQSSVKVQKNIERVCCMTGVTRKRNDNSLRMYGVVDIINRLAYVRVKVG